MSVCNNNTICVHNLKHNGICYKWLPIKSRYLQDYELVSYITKKFNRLFVVKNLNVIAKYYWVNNIDAIRFKGEYKPWIISFANKLTGKNIVNFRLDRSYYDNHINSIIVDSSSGKILCEGIGLKSILSSNGIDFIKDSLFSEEEIINNILGVQTLEDLCIKYIIKKIKKEHCSDLLIPKLLINKIKQYY
ncbi:SWPV1-172 [Shearwaterpox virus]|uniref:SWPV1-172 n=1 Tax=Shearwaterpox virus TaxID=1974596 RepID=A0A1V0S7Z8_CNPV|nr:SWPV1-172 [Shearwaterpox virus]